MTKGHGISNNSLLSPVSHIHVTKKIHFGKLQDNEHSTFEEWTSFEA